ASAPGSCGRPKVCALRRGNRIAKNWIPTAKKLDIDQAGHRSPDVSPRTLEITPLLQGVYIPYTGSQHRGVRALKDSRRPPSKCGPTETGCACGAPSHK